MDRFAPWRKNKGYNERFSANLNLYQVQEKPRLKTRDQKLQEQRLRVEKMANDRHGFLKEDDSSRSGREDAVHTWIERRGWLFIFMRNTVTYE